MVKGKKLYGEIRNYVIIVFGLACYVFSWSAFLIPSDLIGGGISGVSTLIYFVTGIPVGILNFIFNAILVLIAMRILGAKFGINTIFGIIVGALLFLVLQPLFTVPLVNDPFMCALIGGMLSGFGIGIVFTHGGNSGGTDIIALIVTNYRNISPGKVIIICDVVIVAASYLIFQSIEKIVYGYVIMGVFGYTLDIVLEGAKQSYQIIVFSKNNDVIADRIGNELNRGVTFLKGKGWYTKEDQDVLLVIAQKHDKQKIMEIINDSDDKAFLSVAKVSGVFGRNFDRIRL
ncbi:MAG: YitT family protein [Bacteroidales bacterium]|nr:YitT family protein [Bacteroidales bacterium]